MSKIITALIRYRWAFFVLSLVLTAFALLGFRYFVFDASPRIYFNAGDVDYERFEAMEDTYGREYKIFFMLSARQGDMLEPDNLRALREMTDKAWALPFVRRVDSLSNFQYSHSADDELYVEDLFDDAIIADPVALAKRKAIALNDVDIVNGLISADGKHASMVLALTMTGDDPESSAGHDLVEQAYALEDSIKAKYPGIDIYATGNLLSVYHNVKVARGDVTLMIPVMFGLMFLSVGFLLRSVSAVIISLFVAFLAGLSALGLGAWSGITFSALSVNALMITITVAVAHCIHIFTQLFKELQTRPRIEAIAASLRINFYALCMTSITTIIGFLSLNTNDLAPAAALGNAAAIGTGLAWLFSLTMLPALVMVLPFKAHSTGEYFIERQMNRLAEFVITRKYAILLVMTLLTVLAVHFSFSNRLNDKLTETLHKPNLFRADTDAIDQHFGAMYINSYDLDSGSNDGIVDPQYLKNTDKFAQYLRSLPEVVSVYSFADIIKRLNQSMHNDDPAFYSIPDDRELISQYLLLYELSLPFGLDLNEHVTPNKRKTLLSAAMRTQDTQTNIGMDKKIRAWQEDNLPASLQSPNISLSTIWSYLTIHSLTNAMQGAVVALILISLVMLFMLRSVRYGILSLIPNIIPAAFGFGVWYFISGDVGLGLNCVLIITIGIVVDDTVHFLVKYKKALQDHKGDAEQAIRATFRQVGSAICITTIVLAAGFSVLGLSKIILNSALGQVTAVILVAALLLDVLLLPVLLLIVDRNRIRTATAAVRILLQTGTARSP